jgi:hypothetical protein
MPLLMYCVAKAACSVTARIAGVSGTEISRIESHGLTVFFSRAASADIWLRASLRDSALQFHRVLSGFFRSVAIIPFRFPTIIESDQALMQHLEQHAAQYNALLEKFADKVQMDVRISFATTSVQNKQSGAQFLRERQQRNRTLESLMKQISEAARQFARDWRQRRIATGIRGFALLGREQIGNFNNIAAKLSVPAGFEVRVSGPWPVTEFLDLEPIEGANKS